MNHSEIQALLPDVFQQTLDDRNNNEETILAILIDSMHLLHADTELQLQTIEDFFNPCRTPQEKFIEYLGYWTDLRRLWPDDSGSDNSDINAFISRDCLQELILSAAYLSQWRGTQKGLCQFLKIATGSNKISIKDGVNKQGHEQDFHFLVVIPENQKHQLRLIKTIVEQEKPVYISYEIKIMTLAA